MRNFRSTEPALATLVLAAPIPTGVLAEDSDIKQLREQLRQLEQKILVLKRRAELKDEAAATTAKAAPKLTASDGRFEIASADGASSASPPVRAPRPLHSSPTTRTRSSPASKLHSNFNNSHP